MVFQDKEPGSENVKPVLSVQPAFPVLSHPVTERPGLARPEPEPAMLLFVFEAPCSQTVLSEFANFSALSTRDEPSRP